VPRVPATVFFSLLSVQILVAGAFLIPVSMLAIVQFGNFAQNKTTMERYARQQKMSEEDQQNKIVNSGLKNDPRIMIDCYAKRD
jgi:hypothetical protein